MGYNFLPWDHDQQYLLPPDLRDWLPADHEVWALLEAAELLDFTDFFARRRADGWGRAAYHPAMMALLLYAYAQGERSSRTIERRCREDVALRVLCANQTPDHATIARFRAEHEDELKGLHTQVLALCAEAGLGSLGLVALDSTKLAADASSKKSKRYEVIVDELERMYAEAAAADAAEDADTNGEDGGAGRLPRQLAQAERRRARFEQAKAAIDAQVAAEQEAFDAVEERQQAREAAGKKRRGWPPKTPPTRPSPEGRRANVTDPDSRLLRRPGGFVQGYSGQLLATEDGTALAFDAEQNDAHQLHPMLDQAQAHLAAAGLDPSQIKVLLADAGYYCDNNITDAEDDDPELLIATVASSKIAAGKTDPNDIAHRSEVARMMTERLTCDEGRQLYARRACMIEPQFGDDKHNKGFNRFSRRGQPACQAEWRCSTSPRTSRSGHGDAPPRPRPVPAAQLPVPTALPTPRRPAQPATNASCGAPGSAASILAGRCATSPLPGPTVHTQPVGQTTLFEQQPAPVSL